MTHGGMQMAQSGGTKVGVTSQQQSIELMGMPTKRGKSRQEHLVRQVQSEA